MNTTVRNLIAATTAAAAIAVPVTTVALGVSSTPAASSVSGNVAGTTTDTAQSSTSTERPTYSVDTSGGTSALALHRYGEYAQPAGEVAWSSMYEFLEFTIQDVDGFWSSEYVAAGYTEPQVSYRLMVTGESAVNACKPEGTNDTSAFYCPSDDTIYVSQKMMADIWNGTYTGPGGKTVTYGGDFAVAAVVAHEYAHNLQHERGILTRFESHDFERHADCLTGIWARNAESRNLLDPGDIQEGFQAMWLLADVRTKAEGQTHGNTAERQAAFDLGYRTGTLASCDTVLGS